MERKFSLWTFRSLERKCIGTKKAWNPLPPPFYADLRSFVHLTTTSGLRFTIVIHL